MKRGRPDFVAANNGRLRVGCNGVGYLQAVLTSSDESTSAVTSDERKKIMQQPYLLGWLLCYSGGVLCDRIVMLVMRHLLVNERMSVSKAETMLKWFAIYHFNTQRGAEGNTAYSVFKFRYLDSYHFRLAAYHELQLSFDSDLQALSLFPVTGEYVPTFKYRELNSGHDVAVYRLTTCDTRRSVVFVSLLRWLAAAQRIDDFRCLAYTCIGLTFCARTIVGVTVCHLPVTRHPMRIASPFYLLSRRCCHRFAGVHKGSNLFEHNCPVACLKSGAPLTQTYRQPRVLHAHAAVIDGMSYRRDSDYGYVLQCIHQGGLAQCMMRNTRFFL